MLPGGKLSYEDAISILEPMLGHAYQMNALACEKVQQTLNKAAGINLKAQTPPLNRDRVEGFARRIGREENYDDVAWILNEPVKTFSRSVVDDSIKANADFQYKAGLSPKIVRTAEAKCCDWCASLEGEYDYPLENTDVYRRHDNCRCVVEYKPGDGRAQNTHTKQWRDESEERIERAEQLSRHLVNKSVTPQERAINAAIQAQRNASKADVLVNAIVENHEALKYYTPAGMKRILEDAGYSVETLSRGSLKGKPFEEGGGYKINFGGDGIFQYHPAERSHHGGEYWKIQHGKVGVWYDRQGKEIKRNQN